MKENEAIGELQFIKKVLEDSRRIVVDDGMSFILWGIIAATGLLATYFLILEKLWNYISWVWIGLIAIGWVYSITTGIKKGKKERVKTFAGKILAVTWFSSGLAMTIIGMIGSFSGAIEGVYISPLISIILGIAFAITGSVYNDKRLSLLSAGWWTGAIIMFLNPGMYTLLMMALMMIFFQIIPGLLLYKRYKKELNINP